MNKAEKAHKIKSYILMILIAITIIFVIGMVVVQPVYAVKVDGETICVAKNKDDIESAYEEIKSEIDSQNVVIPQKVDIEATYGSNEKVIGNVDEIKEELSSAVNILVQSYAINSNDKDIAYLSTKKEAENVLETLIDSYKEKDNKKEYKEIGFGEQVKIKKKATTKDKLKDKEEVIENITKGKKVPQDYTLKPGDTVWDIMMEHNLSLDEIEKANPSIDLERIKDGEVITLMIQEPLLKVETVEEITYEEKIDYEVQYESSSSMYEGDTKVKQEGKQGEKKIQSEIIKLNGIKKQENIIKEEITKKPQKKIVIRGTKERPKTMATGRFGTPARGRVSSNFGKRWGRNHHGIDIAMPVGTPIKAADGGKVTFAGNKGAYGKVVIINHENGKETRYAHNSKLLVKAGERVYQGQTIAKSGNTGRSTGPHLHFEIRENGKPINPKNYIKF